MKMAVLAFLWLLCLGAMAFGTYRVAVQHHRLTSFRRVEAVVIDAEVKSRFARRSTDRSGSVYLPIVRYDYLVDGNEYRSQSVFPTNVARGGQWGRAWAEGIIERFEPRRERTAWYDPANPAEAFLIKQPVVFPYLFILLPAALVAAATAVLLLPSTDRSGAGKRRIVQAIAVGWFVIGVASAVHYYVLAGSQPDGLAAPIFGAYALLGLVPVIGATGKEGLGGKVQAASIGSLVGAFLGFWVGMAAGWLAGLITDRSLGGPYWAWYGVVSGALLLGLLSFFTGKVE